MGVHVLDVLVRPVERDPRGPGRRAGRADQDHRRGLGRRHGADAGEARRRRCAARARSAPTRSARCCSRLLERGGIDTSLLVRRDDVQTSASVLPIRPDGSRPAFHVVGANATYGPADVDWDRLADADPPAPRRAGVHGRRGRGARSSRAARERGIVTSADVLAPGEPGCSTGSGRRSSTSTTSCPTTTRSLALTGEDDLEAGCRALVERGVGCVAATCGADGVLLVDAEGVAARAGVRDRGRRHDRLRRRVLRRLPARALARPRAAPRPRGSATPPRRWSPRASAPTTATSTSRRPRRSPSARRRGRLTHVRRGRSFQPRGSRTRIPRPS